MVTTLQAPPRAHPARQKALEPFLDRLAGWNATQGGTHDLARKARITVGERVVILEPWERQQIDLWFHGDGPKAQHQPVLVHGAALMLKAAYDIERLVGKNGVDATTFYALQAELMLDTAIGMALLKDAQHAIEELVRSGGTDEAKALTQFRHRLSHVVADAKMCIAESEQAQAAVIAGELSDAPGRSEKSAASPSRAGSAQVHALAQRVSPTEEIAETAAGPLPTVRRRGRPAIVANDATPRRGPSGTQVLALMCLASFAIWMVFVQAPRYMAREAAILTRAQFLEGLPITAVESRAPSAYVSMSQGAWDAMDERGRLDFVQELGRTAAREGYTGLLLKSDAGVPLGQWLAQRGASVIVHGEEVAPPALPPAPTTPTAIEVVPPAAASEAPTLDPLPEAEVAD